MKEKKNRKEKKIDIVEGNKKGLRNTETNIISFAFVLLFFSMIVYLCMFNYRDARNILNNPYNKRVDNQAKKVVRGDILSSEGTVLATTLSEGGNESRYYPYAELFCHSVGFNSTIKTGVEKSCNFYLLSESDNIFEQIANDLSGQKAKGHNVYTTLNFDLSNAAMEALGDNKGAVVVMEPATGKVLAMVSSPSFDPNAADTDYLEWLNYDSTDSVLLNRATQGLYAPGSTFKLLTTLEYIRENDNYKNYEYECSGSAYISGGTSISCFDKKEHGTQDLITAFANSCNAAYSTIGNELDKEKFISLNEKVLFNSDLPIDFEYSKSSFSLDKNATISEMQETAIGQGKTMISPIHNLMIFSAIANNGNMMKPYIVDRIVDSSGKIVLENKSESVVTIANEEECEYLKECMKEVTSSGTGYAFSKVSYEIAGKTGSAQFDNVSDEYHSWFVGFAPVDNPKIAVCVVLEGGYTNVASAQYVAKSVFDTYFDS